MIYNVDPRDQDKVGEWWTVRGPNPDYDVLICDTGILVNNDRLGATAMVTPREGWRGDFDERFQAYVRAYFERKLKEDLLKARQR